MKAKAKTKWQKKPANGGKPTAQAVEDAAKGNEFRVVELGDLVREFSLRLLAGVELDAGTAHFIEEYSSGLGWPKETVVRNVKDAEPPRYASPEAEEQAILAAQGKTKALLDMLRATAADGDRKALSELVQLLAKNVSWLEGYSYREKGNLKELAAHLAAWPVMFNSRPRKQQQVADYLARIGLAPEYDPALRWHQLADAVKAKDVEPPRFNSPEEKGRAILQTSYLAGRLMEEIQHHVADGNLLATVKFVILLEANVTWLESYSVRDKGNLKAVASLTPVWPVMMECCSRRTKAAVEYLKNIEQGTKAQISLSPKWGTTWHNEGAVATHYARGIRIAVHSARTFFQSYDKKLETNGPLSRGAWENIPQWIKNAGKLAPLTKESAPQWFEIGWQLLVEKHKGHPENDEQLRKLGSFRRLHYVHQEQQKNDTARTTQSNICDGIRQRIREALISLSPIS